MGLILVRYGEIALKGKNRAAFVRQLRHNIRVALRENGLAGDVYEEGQRLYVETEQPELAIPHLQRVFGIVSVSPVVAVERSLEAMQDEALRMAARFGLSAEHSYRVDARRADKSFPLISPEINRLVGSVVQEATGAKVDLTGTPDLTIGIEVRRDRVLMYGEVMPGPGGLPLPTGGRAITLLSGGIDSPVAAWMMMKRGCGIIPLHFARSPADVEKVMEQCAVLARYAYGWHIKPIVLSHAEIIEPILMKLYELDAGRWACIFCKRAMLQKAVEIANTYHAQAIVTGDSLGQVASQTLDNLEVISYGIQKPILRPLIGMDKTEIMALARKIGTFEISVQVSASCPYLPPNPLTKGDVETLKELMEKLEAL